MHNNKLIGKTVRVRDPGRYTGLHSDITGAIGVVCAYWSSDSIGVKLEGVENKASKYKYFYFSYAEIEIIDPVQTEKTKGEIEMSKIENYVNVAVVQFMDGNNPNTYEYANFEPDLVVGDCCVVMTAHHGMSLARVVEMKESTEDTLYREVVAKFDTAPYEDRCEKRKHAAELKAKMQERAKQLQDLVLFQTLAKEDADMAKLLAEYKSLV